MSEDGDDVGTIIAGVFLILFGLCVTLVGGACTALWVGLMVTEPGSWEGMSIMLLLISVAVLAAGIFAIVMGIRLLRRRGQQPPAFVSAEPGADLAASRPHDEGLNKPD
jgi:type VI protein secretion system component VasK